MTYHYCTHYFNDPEDYESIEDDIEVASLEDAKNYVVNELEHPLTLDYYWIEGENGEYFNSKD